MTQEYRFTPLMMHIKNGDINKVKKTLFKYPLIINQQDFDGYTALTYAIEGLKNNVKIEIIDELLKNENINLDLKNHREWNPLLLCIKYCYWDNNHKPYSHKYSPQLNQNFIIIAKKLITLGCDLNVVNSRNQNALNMLCSLKMIPNEIIQLIKLLIMMEIDINNCDYKGYTPLMTLCKNGSSKELFDILIQCENINLDQQDRKKGWTAMRIATTLKDKITAENMIHWLLDRGADPKLMDNQIWTMYELAIIHFSKKLTDKLIQKGVKTSNTYFDVDKMVLKYGK